MNDGAWPSGKARDFGSRIRRFESSRPNHTSSEAPMAYELKLLTGNANRPLAEEIGKSWRLPLAAAEVSRFSEGEVYVQITETVRGADVFVIQPTCPPVNDTLMELLIMIDALKRASARRITAVLPYYGYARQDRKVQPRVPISARLVADLLEAAGIDRVLALDLHAGQIQGFFRVPVDHLFAAPVIIDYLGKKELREPVIVAPDAGGVERARAIAKRLTASLAIIDKRRGGGGQSPESTTKSRPDRCWGDLPGGSLTMERQDLTIKRREATGKAVAKRLRRAGEVPAILYGGAKPEPVLVDPKAVLKMIHGREGTTQLLTLKFDGEAGGGTREAIIRALQIDPGTEQRPPAGQQ